MTAEIKKIEEILGSCFSMDNYVALIGEIFSSAEMVAPYKKQEEYSNFSSHIVRYFHVANYETPVDERLIIVAVELKKDSYVENARSTQRSYAKKLIESSNSDAAVVAFYTEGDPKWRLSFVRLDYEMKFENGKLQVAENITPAKRYSYLVGPDEPSHTAIERLYLFIIDKNARPTLDDLEEVFSVEKVTKEFFNLYCDKYHQLREYLLTNEDFLAESEKCGFSVEQFAKKLMGQIVFLYFLQKKGWLGVGVWPSSLTETEYKHVYFDPPGVQKRVIQEYLPLVYRKEGDIYVFHQEVLLKGPNDVDKLPDDAEEFIANNLPQHKIKNWGEGSQHFLRTLFEYHQNHQNYGKNFYNDYLEYLFYDTLNKNRGSQGYCPRFHCRIPFLSGGLFEPINGYDWKVSDFCIPDEIFSNRIDNDPRTGDGILDIFDRYNFTMSEDEPMEREVAIDPEMLGKVFENLLDVTDRKSKGAFYTPREIVHFMCQESLINYLTTATGLAEKDICDFILYGDFMKDEDTVKEKRLGNGAMYISEEIFKIDEKGNVVVNRLKDIDDSLANIRIADPAVGSGAFPVGMLNEIVRARQNITEYMAVVERTKAVSDSQAKRFVGELHERRSAYYLKWYAIKNSIFAVDIEPSAIDIAQLRLWLSLVIDDEINPNATSILYGHPNPCPLPNLECNILCGNSLVDEFEGYSLLGINSEIGTEQVGDEYSWNQNEFDVVISKILEIQDAIFSCNDPIKKPQLLEELDALKDNAIETQLTYMEPEVRERYKKCQKLASKPYILWQLEFARVFRDKGGFDVIIGNPPYGAKLSDYDKAMFKKKYSDVHMRTPDTYNYFISKGFRLLHFKGVMSFIVPNTLLFQNEYENTRIFLTEKNCLLKVVNIGENVFERAEVPTCIFVAEKNQKPAYIISYADYRDVPNDQIIWGNYPEEIDIDILRATPGYVLGVNEKENRIFEKVKVLSVTIDDIASEMAAGISTGGNDVFCVSLDMAEQFEFEKDMLRRLLKGKIIDRYENHWSDELIIYSTKDTNTPEHKNVYEYLLPFEEKLSQKRETKKGLIPWYSLHWPRNPELFSGTKIVMRQTSDCIRATIDRDDFFALNTLLVLKIKENMPFSYEFVLAVLNSKINNFIYRNLTQEKRRNFAEVKPKNVRKLYIPDISRDDQKIYEDIVNEIYEGTLNKEEGMRRIDEMLYSFYGLEQSEILLINEEIV